MMGNALLHKLKSGGNAGCVWLTLGSPSIAELMLQGQPDAMVFDQQHGLWDRLSLEHAIGMVAHATTPMVRIKDKSDSAIGEALDAGAKGILVPLIETVAEAEQVVQAAFYPPKGRRSGGGIRPLKDFKNYTKYEAGDILIGVMIETAKGLANAEKIARVPGIDMVFIGTGDLALSLGVYPDLGPSHEKAIKTICKATKAAGKIAGTFTFHAQPGLDRLAQGFQFVVQAIDSELISSGAKASAKLFYHAKADHDPIKGKIALVTGANRGIGVHIVEALLEHGAKKVYCGMRDAKAFKVMPASYKKYKGRVKPIMLDVTDQASIKQAVASCADVELLINNAGINFNMPLFGKANKEAARQEMEVNYFGLLNMCRSFAPILKKNGGGIVVNMLSILAMMNLPMMGSLCASKAAAFSLTQALRAELKKQGTRIVGVLPGAVDTEMTKDFDGPKIPPEQVAEAIIFGLKNGLEEIYPGNMASGVAAAISLDTKAIEREFAQYLPKST